MQTKEAKLVDRDVKHVEPTDTRKRILLVDDHAVVRFGIAQLINRQSDLVVCGEQEDARKALDAIESDGKVSEKPQMIRIEKL